MTEGRFEASPSAHVNDAWHERNFWTKHNRAAARMFHPHQRDLMERESCPFHDLRADGCFQYERHGAGDPGLNIDPDKLTRRPDGKRLQFGSVKSKRFGVGGIVMPEDTAPPAEQVTLSRRTDSRPWTTTSTGKTNLFSTFGYVALPPGSGDPLLPPSHPIAGAFKCGRAIQPISPHAHLPDGYVKQDLGRPPFRLKAGVPRVLPDSRLRHAPEGPAVRARSATTYQRPTFVDRVKSISGTFNQHPEHLPEPWAPPSLRSNRRPIFTYHTHTKRSMPVTVLWETGTKDPQAIQVK